MMLYGSRCDQTVRGGAVIIVLTGIDFKLLTFAVLVFEVMPLGE